eukprot:g8128.t1
MSRTEKSPASPPGGRRCVVAKRLDPAALELAGDVDVKVIGFGHVKRRAPWTHLAAPEASGSDVASDATSYGLSSSTRVGSTFSQGASGSTATPQCGRSSSDEEAAETRPFLKNTGSNSRKEVVVTVHRTPQVRQSTPEPERTGTEPAVAPKRHVVVGVEKTRIKVPSPARDAYANGSGTTTSTTSTGNTKAAKMKNAESGKFLQRLTEILALGVASSALLMMAAQLGAWFFSQNKAEDLVRHEMTPHPPRDREFDWRFFGAVFGAYVGGIVVFVLVTDHDAEDPPTADEDSDDSATDIDPVLELVRGSQKKSSTSSSSPPGRRSRPTSPDPVPVSSTLARSPRRYNAPSGARAYANGVVGGSSSASSSSSSASSGGQRIGFQRSTGNCPPSTKVLKCSAVIGEDQGDEGGVQDEAVVEEVQQEEECECRLAASDACVDVDADWAEAEADADDLNSDPGKRYDTDGWSSLTPASVMPSASPSKVQSKAATTSSQATKSAPGSGSPSPVDKSRKERPGDPAEGS